MSDQLHTVAQFQGRKAHCFLFIEVNADSESYVQSYQLISSEIAPELRGTLVDNNLYWIKRTPAYFECVEEVTD